MLSCNVIFSVQKKKQTAVGNNKLVLKNKKIWAIILQTLFMQSTGNYRMELYFNNTLGILLNSKNLTQYNYFCFVL